MFRRLITYLFSELKKDEPQGSLPTIDKGNAHTFHSTGAQNKNPLNVKQIENGGWRGQIGVDSRGHVEFMGREWGIRAAIINLRTYQHKYKKKSVVEILSKWAPSTDTIGSLPNAPPNSPKDYSKFVEKHTGLNIRKPLRLFLDREVRDKETLWKLLKAMAAYENGRNVKGKLYQLSRVKFEKALTLV